MKNLRQSHILLKGDERTRSKILGETFDVSFKVILPDVLHLPLYGS